MRLRVMIVLLALTACLLPLASSSIFIEPLNGIYNYGDQLVAETKIVPSSATSGHYIADIVCGSLTINVFNSFFDLPANIERPVTITTQVLNPLLDNITSACFLRATFASEIVNSNSFTLSKKINIDSEIEFDNLNPSESLRVEGTAVKESGTMVNGFIELFVPSLNLYRSGIVTNGVFNLSLMIPTDAKSGVHNITLEAHNTDHNSRKINFGSTSETIAVSQVLKEIEIVFNSENVEPNTDFTFTINAFDQARDQISREVSVAVHDPKGIPIMKKVIKSGEMQTLKFSFNDTPGYWNVETVVDELTERKLFYLTEVQKIQTSLINNTLFVTNIGNAPYSGPLEITIGSVVEVKQIRLGVGESQKFTLRAPDGDYTISVSEGGEPTQLGSTFLTGNAIKVTDFREDVLGTITNPLIWWLAIILLVLIIVLVQVKIRMQRHAPNPMASSGMVVKPQLKNDFVLEDKAPIFMGKKESSTQINSAKPLGSDSGWAYKPQPKTSFVNSNVPNTFNSFASAPKVAPTNLFADNSTQGIREHAVAIALYVSGNSPNAAPLVTSALSIAQEVGAKIYVDGEYKIILFSPRLLKTDSNESSAVSVARRIQALLLEHAKVHRDGLSFGIGVNDGEIISEIENSKFHFTSTGNLISMAKRIAGSANMKLLISDSVRRKVISTVKAEKSSFPGVWEVVRVVDHSESRDFIKRFSDRNR